MVAHGDEQARHDERTERRETETGDDQPVVGSLGQSIPSHTSVIRPRRLPGKGPDAFLTSPFSTLMPA